MLVGLGSLMVVTMYQLACSVQLVISRIHTVEQLNLRRNIVYTLAFIFTFTFTGIVLAIFLIPSLGENTMFYT